MNAASRPGSRPMPDHACRLVQVAPDVWTATSSTWTSVSTIVVAADGSALVIDPNVDPAELVLLVDEVALHGWTTVAGFSTHPHWDHVLWPAAWSGVARWATKAAVREAAARRPELIDEAGEVAAGHDHTWTGLLTALTAGRLPWPGPTAIAVRYPGHCPGSAALWLPDSAVLVTGDVLSDREIPLLAEPSAAEPDPVAAYRASLDLLAAIPARVLVPGHGTVTGTAGMRHRLAADRTYLDLLVASAGTQGPGGSGVPAGTYRDLASSDPRLSDPEQAEQHARQLALVTGPT